ncbi:MAG: hypothetical protein QM754_01025 [Tepidisphaeraceae bacterium]
MLVGLVWVDPLGTIWRTEYVPAPMPVNRYLPLLAVVTASSPASSVPLRLESMNTVRSAMPASPPLQRPSWFLSFTT